MLRRALKQNVGQGRFRPLNASAARVAEMLQVSAYMHWLSPSLLRAFDTVP